MRRARKSNRVSIHRKYIIGNTFYPYFWHHSPFKSIDSIPKTLFLIPLQRQLYILQRAACMQVNYKKKQPIFHKNNITQPVSQHHNTVARKNAITHFPFKWLSSQDRPIHSGARDAPNSSKTSQGNTWTIYGELFTQHFGLNSIYVYQFWWELENFLEFLLNFRIF